MGVASELVRSKPALHTGNTCVDRRQRSAAARRLLRGPSWLPSPRFPQAADDATAPLAEIPAQYEAECCRVMAERFGQSWALSPDLPAEAYLAEAVFLERLSDLQDAVEQVERHRRGWAALDATA